MVRALIFFLVYVAAGATLKSLWPTLPRGWRAWALLGGSAVSLGILAMPLVLPTADLPLVARIFAVGWTLSAVILLLAGLPVLLVRRWVEGRSRKAPEAAPLLEVPPATAPLAGVMSRRALLTNAGRAVPMLAVGTSTAGLAGGSTGFKVKTVEVRLPNLPAAMDGFRIGQITDVHVGNFIDTQYLRDAVAAMNDAKVDLQVMTGDLIDDLEQLDGTMAALETCQAPHGMLAILGNHEHWRGLEEIVAAYEASRARGSPVRLLVDESHTLEHAGQRVRVVGVDYPISGRRGMRVKLERMLESARKAFQGVSPDEVLLCLTHHPDFFDLAAERGARLTLAGHTHGGQVAFFGLPLFWFVFQYMLGRYRRGDHQLYVSGGTGHWLPFRLGVAPEVTVLTLRAV
ncbi:metallophosphoesterase [Myxococcus stipitatus DSM 14675]|uniref:Metallophosphoesterase n=1 Tax=Myxococcus stipitatus (strain DSM 14675 / JCM 12634 / Mx s8) TaxID=1278073 RepID=L7UJV2_MYXSD|nr:metallophosphoesterase [Myxococcus stipitatus]AGC48278.1 metallophosphoesterase [Myxococcus stipitatus DSM 14675]